MRLLKPTTSGRRSEGHFDIKADKKLKVGIKANSKKCELF